MSNTIKAIRVHEFGKPMVLENIPSTKPGPNEVLISVKAAGVNPVDTYFADGHMPSELNPKVPYTPGGDGAGIIDAVGPGVKDFKVGDRVFFALNGTGAYAEKVVAKLYAPLPDSLSFEQGAAIGVPYFTAFRSLHQIAKAKPGETVLVHGASGGVGIASCQVAKALGLHVIGTAGSEEAMATVLKEGHADQVFNHSKKGYVDEIKSKVKGQINIILEMLADKNLLRDIDLAGDFGRIVIVGSRGEISWNPAALFYKEVQVLGVILFHMPPADTLENLLFLSKHFADGSLVPLVGKRYPLAQANEAHKEIIVPTAPTRGKLILTIP